MNEYCRLVKRRVFFTLLFNPAFMLVYAVSWVNIKILSRTGPAKGNIESLITCFIFYFCWSLIYLLMLSNDHTGLKGQVIQEYLIDSTGITVSVQERLEFDFEEMWNYILTKNYLFITMKNGSIVVLNNKKILENSEYNSIIKNNKKNMSLSIYIWNIVSVILIVLIPLIILLAK